MNFKDLHEYLLPMAYLSVCPYETSLGPWTLKNICNYETVSYKLTFVRFEVFMTVTIKITVFLEVTPCMSGRSLPVIQSNLSFSW
jgi:hypothetical protein